MPTRTLRLATRGSALARRQAATIQSPLEQRRYEVDLVEVETTGDQVRDELIHRLGKTGAFVRSLDEKVLDGSVDGAVHSMKDMPTESPEELVVAGIPERAAPGDTLLTPDGRTLEELPSGAVVGTSSLRRGAQLRAARSDVQIEPLRGNVDTRIEKLLAPSLQREHERRLEAESGETAPDSDDPSDETDSASAGGPDAEFDRTVEAWFGSLSALERSALERRPETEYDAIVLAEAGLDRAGLADEVPTTALPTAEFVPAPGQGALAVTAVAGAEVTETLLEAIDHPRTRVETSVERVVLAELGGGCVAPIGVHAVLKGEYVHVDAAIFDQEGKRSIEGHRDLPAENYVEAAREFASDLHERGATDLIADAVGEDEPREAKRE